MLLVFFFFFPTVLYPFLKAERYKTQIAKGFYVSSELDRFL